MASVPLESSSRSLNAYLDVLYVRGGTVFYEHLPQLDSKGLYAVDIERQFPYPLPGQIINRIR